MVLRRHLGRISVGTRVLRSGGYYRRRLEGAEKAETRPLAEYDPLRVHPNKEKTRSTPNMTGRRFHRTMEMIPARPW